MKRVILSILAALSLLAPSAVFAQAATSKVVGTCGTQTYVAGKMQYPTMDTTGNACSSATGGGGGGSASYTAAAAPFTVTAGVNKPAGISTANSAQWTVPVKPGTTTEIDLSAPSALIGVNGTTIATNANPLPTNVAQLNGAVPSLTNPIFVANAEAADTSGTFTNATQTTSITNSSADGYAAGLISINGTYGTASGVFEVSDDAGTTWYSVICGRSDGSASETGYTSLTNVNRQWSCPVGGNDSLRVRSTAVASGTLNARVGISAPPPSSTTTFGTVAVPATATGGATPSHAIVANNTTSVAIDASPGTLYSVQVFNNSATIAYLKFYDAAQGSVTCGSGTPKKVVLIPANTSGAGAVIPLGGAAGVAFVTAITRCVTTGIADNDTGAPAASAYLVEADFK